MTATYPTSEMCEQFSDIIYQLSIVMGTLAGRLVVIIITKKGLIRCILVLINFHCLLLSSSSITCPCDPELNNMQLAAAFSNSPYLWINGEQLVGPVLNNSFQL